MGVYGCFRVVMRAFECSRGVFEVNWVFYVYEELSVKESFGYETF